MSYSLFFNKHKINYFIQGQELNISFIFRNTFFVLIYYWKDKNILNFNLLKKLFLKKTNRVINIYIQIFIMMVCIPIILFNYFGGLCEMLIPYPEVLNIG
jgi:hypothetical protein